MDHQASIRRQPTTAGLHSDSGCSAHVADRLVEAVARMAAPVCVGIDPVFERLPVGLRSSATSLHDRVQAISNFVHGVCEAVAGHVPCVKLQSACFERYGSAGVAELERSINLAQRLNLIVIVDSKRGDIGISAEHYAAAVFGIDAIAPADWVTINSYLGADGITPFLQAGGGAFALVRTSNSSSDVIQAAQLANGGTVAEHVAGMIAAIGEAYRGPESGYSALGAVVGATKVADVARLRSIMPHQIFLVPGYGAQGGGIDDVLPCFNRDGLGAIVTASRSVIYAFDEGDSRWQEQVGEAAATFAAQIGCATGLRR